MVYSIVVPTVGRVNELKSLLYSINEYCQGYKYEIIIVDQNVTNILDNLMHDFSYLNIKHIKCELKGASYARNFGLKHVNGDIICFPDDDCEFTRDTLNNVSEIFDSIDCDLVFGKCIDREGNDSVINFSSNEDYLNLKHHEGMFVEATMFAKSNFFIDNIFDVELGVGTFHGAEEAYDLVLRSLKLNKKLYYSPLIKLYHPHKVIDYRSESSIKRVFTYRCGFSKLCVKHKMYKLLLVRFFSVLFYILYLFITRNKKLRYYSAELLGIMSGIVVK